MSGDGSGPHQDWQNEHPNNATSCCCCGVLWWLQHCPYFWLMTYDPLLEPSCWLFTVVCLHACLLVSLVVYFVCLWLIICLFVCFCLPGIWCLSSLNREMSVSIPLTCRWHGWDIHPSPWMIYIRKSQYSSKHPKQFTTSTHPWWSILLLIPSYQPYDEKLSIIMYPSFVHVPNPDQPFLIRRNS